MPPLYRQVRWWILAMLFAVTVINFVDRLTLSYVAPVIKQTFDLSNTDYGFIVSCFMFGMMIGEYPMGWLMDRQGPRRGLTFAVLWWSIATALHAVGQARWHFALFRFWMGTGECGNYSGGSKVIGQWFPARERAFAMGVMNGASLIGNMITPPLVVFLMTAYSWHVAFLIPSALGFLWVIVWQKFYRAPEEHPRLTPAEMNYIKQDDSGEPTVSPTTAELLRRRETWAVMLCRLLIGPVIQFYLFWLPIYLSETRGYSIAAIGLLGIIPPIFGDIGSIGGGWITGFFISAGLSVRRARQAVMFGGALLCALSVVVVLGNRPFVWWAAICLVYLGHYALSANFFVTISDFFPNNAVARVTGLTGIAGGFSGWLFPIMTGWLVDRVSFVPVFFLAAVMPLAGVAVLFALSRETKDRPLQTQNF